MFSKELSHLKRSNLILIALVLITSIGMECYNHFFTHYRGIVYVHPKAISLLVIIFLIYFGLKLSLEDKAPYLSNLCFYTGTFITVLWALAQFTNAVQLTPFAPIDPLLHQLDLKLQFNLIGGMQVTQQYPKFKHLLELAYASLNTQILILPLCLILTSQYEHFLKTMALFLLTSLLGFTIYYFFPSTGPATLLNLPIFSPAHFATGIKFNEIHQMKLASTIEGGLIAFPSFHVIWAIVCQYAALGFKSSLVFYLVLTLNTLLILACPLLGWHYLIDLIGAAAVFLLALYLLKRFSF